VHTKLINNLLALLSYARFKYVSLNCRSIDDDAAQPVSLYWCMWLLSPTAEAHGHILYRRIPAALLLGWVALFVSAHTLCFSHIIMLLGP